MKHVLQHSQAARWALLLVAGGLAVSSADAAHLILQGGSRVDGRGVRLNARGDYVIETASGSRTYPAAQVLRAEADKPDGFDRAIAAANAGQDEQAIAALTEIARRNRGLGWDSRAQASIAQIQMSRNNFAGAVDAFEAVGPEGIAASPRSRPCTGRPCSRRRAMRNWAHCWMSPSVKTTGPWPHGHKLARRHQAEAAFAGAGGHGLSAYRAFSSRRSEDVQPEALYKAGVALEEMRHPKAKDMFDTLMQQYPQSDYAKRARNR